MQGDRLSDAAPDLARILKRSMIHTPAKFAVPKIRCETVMAPMRDGVRLATDLYLPPELPAPSIAIRTPYGKSADMFVSVFLSFARRGYVVIAQDCRGTGQSEPEGWDYNLFEPEDGYDCVEWVTRQPWFNGFIGACGGSYVGQVQWHMAVHPRMSAIAPEVSGAVTTNTVSWHMFANAYAMSVGKGEEKIAVPYTELEGQMLEETFSTGFYNEPLHTSLPEALIAHFPELSSLSPSEAKHRLWEHYCSLSCAQRVALVKQATGSRHVNILDMEAFPDIFGVEALRVPHPRPVELCRAFQAPALIITGWYDWGLNDTLVTWDLITRETPEPVRSRCRLFIAPSSHNMLGYQEGIAEHPELQHSHRIANNVELLLHWYASVREGTTSSWPRVIYYLMGANEWRVSDCWPPSDAHLVPFYFEAGGSLSTQMPQQASEPDRYRYDPSKPTPTVGGSIVSYVYPPGSVDVSLVQQRQDVLTYTTAPFTVDLDVVGPLRLILYASSSAVDTDFVARLTDVFPDGRAIQLQNGVLRARYRNLPRDVELLEPGRIYRLEIDLWATANCFKAGHRLRVDLSSADFPRYNRNANRGGISGPPITAEQTIYHDAQHPSHLLVSVLRSEAR